MSRPIVIAHRGASGYVPEHTLGAKILAFGLGADFVEQDVVATRDAELVVLHDIFLDDVTDVAERFPGRARPDGHYYVVDFELAELRDLNVSERRKPGLAEAMYPERFPLGVRGLGIVTIDEELDLVRSLNRSMGRNVGIYPEIKEPSWHHRHGIDLARLLLEKLDDHGYRNADARAYVQCFDAHELQRVRFELRAELQLIQLVDASTKYSELLSADGLANIASYANGLGPHYSQLAAPRADASIEVSPIATAAKAAGLELHPYTFRRDNLPAYVKDLDTLLAIHFLEVGVDGVFCDHPDVAVRVRNALFGS
jgi:glycerophosphoryl diester phosphodiesterase